MYYRARYYHAGCARFISEDPIGWASGQTNNYAYVGGDPVSFTDPSGLCGWTDAIVGFGDAFGAGLIRDALGIGDGLVDTNGAWYNGGLIGGTIWGLVPFGLGGAAAYGGTRAGHWLNHNRHLRIGPGRWPKNANGMPPGNAVPRMSSPHLPGDGHVDLRSRLPQIPPIGAALSEGGGGGRPCP
jgi:uncharacterized protein RhaS with RHS repeats